MGSKIALRALTVLLVLCGAALVVLVLRPARIEKMPPQPPAGTAATQELGQFTALDRPLPAPALAFAARDGAEKHLADFKGRLVLVNLWATWCAPCVAEMPALDRLQAQLGDKLTILAISQDRQGKTAVDPFLQRVGIRHLAIYLDPAAKASIAFHVAGLPSSFLISPGGMILGKEEGGAQWDQPAMVAVLQRYIAAK